MISALILNLKDSFFSFVIGKWSMGRDLETVWIFGSVVLPSIDNVCLDKQTEITVIVQWALVFFGFLVGLFGSSLFSSWWAWPEVLFILKKKKKENTVSFNWLFSIFLSLSYLFPLWSSLFPFFWLCFVYSSFSNCFR